MLNGKNIVITGANRGIGKAIAESCILNNANVWLCARNTDCDGIKELLLLAEEKSVHAESVSLDLSSGESIKEAFKQIADSKRTIDGLVNNAGTVGATKLFTMTLMDEIRDTFEVNFFGPMFLTQKIVKKMMRSKNGSIVNIASIAALDGEPAQLEYVSSKAAVAGATKKLASELGQFNIRVNAVAPGLTDTGMIEKMDADIREKTLDRTIMHRAAKTEEIANVVTFLLSDKSSYVTGQIIRVDGGNL